MQHIDELLNITDNKTLVCIFPHPDDETVMASGLMLYVKKLGWKVVVICLTRGEGGEIHINGNGKSLAYIRRIEFEHAMQILGVDAFELCNFGDGRLSQNSNWKKPLKSMISKYIPGIIVTYDHSGVSGHPDHIILGEWIYSNYNKSKRVQIVWPTFNGAVRKSLEERTLTAHKLTKPMYTLPLDKALVKTKMKTLKAHKSQDLSTPLAWIQQEPTEYFSIPQQDQTYSYTLVNFDLGH